MFMLLYVSETLVKQSETSETISNNQHLTKKTPANLNFTGVLCKNIMGDNILLSKKVLEFHFLFFRVAAKILWFLLNLHT